MLRFLSLLVFCPAICSTTPSKLNWKTELYQQMIDHSSSKKYDWDFPQRVKLTTDFFDPSGPYGCVTFLYPGGHGPLEDYVDKYHSVVEYAEDFGAAVIFMEHRFYGQSQPLDGRNASIEELSSLLNLDQVLGDYLDFLADYLGSVVTTKDGKTYQMTTYDCKVIAFGVNYEGMLAVYLRKEVDRFVQGALASGAPINMPKDTYARTVFWGRLNQTYSMADETGPIAVRNLEAWYKAIALQWAYIKEGHPQDDLKARLNLCNNLTTDNEYDYRVVLRTVNNVFVQHALGRRTLNGAYDATAVRDADLNVSQSANAIKKMVYDFYGLDEETDCLDPCEVYRPCADLTGCADGSDGDMWDWQLCYELDWVAGGSASAGMVPNAPFSDVDRQNFCQKKFKGLNDVSKSHELFASTYGIDQITNVIWTNGQLDPFYASGKIDYTNNDTATVGSMEGATFGLDMMGSGYGDAQMEEYRRIEKKLIGQILNGTFPE